jgi:hypothetical protein
MSFGFVVEASGVALLAALLVLREIFRRARIQYEYRWETFAVREGLSRQLLHIRQSEIASLTRMTIPERLAGFGRFKQLSRSTFGPRVVIHSKVAHTIPYVVSWEGRAIAGLIPKGLKLRAGETAADTEAP